jgi:uncharacterized protein YggE
VRSVSGPLEKPRQLERAAEAQETREYQEVRMNKKWLWVIGSVGLLVPIVALTACKVSIPEVPSAASPIEVNVTNQQEGISVSGEGKVTVTPDVATVSLGIEAQAATVGEAQSEASSAMDRVVNALANNGVADKDIQTQYFNISQVTRWDANTQQQITIGYSVTNTVAAKIRELDKVGTIIDAVAAAGGDYTRVNNISFSIDDPTIYQKEARDEAMANAQSKAEQLANLSGVKLGPPTYISESSTIPVPIYQSATTEAPAPTPAPTTPITPGQLDVTVDVQVVYSILR